LIVDLDDAHRLIVVLDDVHRYEWLVLDDALTCMTPDTAALDSYSVGLRRLETAACRACSSWSRHGNRIPAARGAPSTRWFT
jgi:hypothetical protein